MTTADDRRARRAAAREALAQTRQTRGKPRYLRDPAKFHADLSNKLRRLPRKDTP